MNIKWKKPFPAGRTFQEWGLSKGQFIIHTHSLENKGEKYQSLSFRERVTLFKITDNYKEIEKIKEENI